MTTPFPIAFLIAFAAGALATAAERLVGRTDAEKPRPRFGVWLGLAAATLILSALQSRLPAPPSVRADATGPSLGFLVLAALPLALATFQSDRTGRPKSERHVLGLGVSGLALYLAGFAFPVLTSPLAGTVAVAAVWQVVLCVLWLFLLASIVELMSLLPLGVGLFGLALSCVIWLAGGQQQTVASYALSGIIAGALLGRGAATLLSGGPAAPLSKTEVFAVAFWLTALTNEAFYKSVALAGFVLPLGAVAVVLVVLTLRGFERSLILRPTPRGE